MLLVTTIQTLASKPSQMAPSQECRVTRAFLVEKCQVEFAGPSSDVLSPAQREKQVGSFMEHGALNIIILTCACVRAGASGPSKQVTRWGSWLEVQWPPCSFCVSVLCPTVRLSMPQSNRHPSRAVMQYGRRTTSKSGSRGSETPCKYLDLTEISHLTTPCSSNQGAECCQGCSGASKAILQPLCRR